MQKKYSECDHDNVQDGKASKFFQGEEFVYNTLVCCDCEAVLSTDETRRLYYEWLEKLYSKKRDLFRVEYSVSEELEELLQKYGKFLRCETSALVKVLVISHIDMFLRGDPLVQKIKEVKKSKEYCILLNAPVKIKKEIRFNPRGFLKVMTQAEMEDVSTRDVIERAMMNMLLLLKNEQGKVENSLDTFLSVV